MPSEAPVASKKGDENEKRENIIVYTYITFNLIAYNKCPTSLQQIYCARGAHQLLGLVSLGEIG